MDAAKQAIEPQFLSQALSQRIPLRIAQVNKAEHEGVLQDVGRYEINVETESGVVTILKQDISSLTAPSLLLTQLSSSAPAETDAERPPVERAVHASKPNIQQEFLDKAIKERLHLTIFLLSGQRIRAAISAYDNFTILVNEGGRQSIYYKHAISTINR